MNQAMEDPVRTDLSEFGYIEKKMGSRTVVHRIMYQSNLGI